MKIKKVLVLIMAICLSVSLFVACGGDEGGSEATKSPASQSPASQAPATEAPATETPTVAPTEEPTKEPVSDPTTSGESTAPSSQTDALSTSTVQTTRPSAQTTRPTTPTTQKKDDESSPTFVDSATCQHDFKVISLEDSTCAKMGKKVSYCAKCDTTRTENILKKTTHTGGKATCKARAICTVCEQPYGKLADHYCANEVDDCTKAVYCDTCNTLMRAATEHVWVNSCITDCFCLECSVTSSERIHTFIDGKCYYCHADDPNYSGSSGGGSGSGGNSGVGGSGNSRINWSMTTFPDSISYGTIQSATADISGSTLILRITMKRNTSGGSHPMEAYYRISNSSFKTVATGSYSSDSLGPGATATVTVTIPDVITSSTGKYYVFLSRYPSEW